MKAVFLKKVYSFGMRTMATEGKAVPYSLNGKQRRLNGSGDCLGAENLLTVAFDLSFIVRRNFFVICRIEGEIIMLLL